jgi:alpha-pyrone synthase
MNFQLMGFGTAVPEAKINVEQSIAATYALCPILRTADWVPVIFQHSGIANRHQAIGQNVLEDLLNGTNYSNSPFLPKDDRDSSGPTTQERMQLYMEVAPKLAIRAAKLALIDAGWEASSITHLITISCTGFFAPGMDYHLINGLKLSPTVERTQIGFMGCHAALNGLRVANAYARSNPEAKILMVAVELCSLHYYYGSTLDKQIANALFADGAAAIVGKFGDDSWQVAATGSCLVPDSADAMTWTIGDSGFEMTLSRQIPTLIAKNLRPWLSKWLEANGLSINEIQSWAIHPGGPRILSAVEEGLGLPSIALEVSRKVLHDYGNMSSPTVLFILQRLKQARAPLPCVALGFGPGLVAEGVLFR